MISFFRLSLLVYVLASNSMVYAVEYMYLVQVQIFPKRPKGVT